MKAPTGFTLIELMVVVAIVAILAAIALPTYQDQIRKGRRSDALRVLEEIRMGQERYRADRPRYATIAELNIGNPNTAYYTFALVKVDPPAIPTFTVTATAVGAQGYDKQDGVLCTALSIDQAGVKGPAGKEACWRN